MAIRGSLHHCRDSGGCFGVRNVRNAHGEPRSQRGCPCAVRGGLGQCKHGEVRQRDEFTGADQAHELFALDRFLARHRPPVWRTSFYSTLATPLCPEQRPCAVLLME